MTKLKVHQLDAAAGSDGQVPVISGGKFVIGDAPGGNSSGLPVFDVIDYGALVDGITDDTPAWQRCINAAAAAGGGRIISSKPGVSIIAGALQDTAGANAQLLLPSIAYVGGKQVTIVIEGPTPPPPVYSVIGTTPVPDQHLVLKSTIAGTADGAVLGGIGPAGTTENFTNVFLQLRNLAVRTPSNPLLTGLNLSRTAAVDLDNVIVDTGSYDISSLPQPTTSSSYGIRLPANNNGAYTRLGAVNVSGFYTGYQFAEHSVGQQVNAWGCMRAFEFNATNHASKFQRMMAVHCPRGFVFTGTHYVDVDQFDIEHDSVAHGGWMQPLYDLDDPSNYGHGTITWHTVLGDVGPVTDFFINGAANIHTAQVGATPSAGGSLAVQDENGTIATGVTQLDFQGAGVTATAGPNGEVVVTVPGASASPGAGELLMQNGATAPPVPLENENRDDWLYQG